MLLPQSYFKDFLSGIRLTPTQRGDAATGHSRLRDRLSQDETLSPRIVSSFIQGSYKRATAIRPQADNRSDVDVVVVTTLDESQYEPQEALELFIPFLERHYKDKYRMQGRSLGIELSTVELDLVVTSAPAESQLEVLKAFEATNGLVLQEDEANVYSTTSSLFGWITKSAQAQWKLEPLRIPNRDTNAWEDTHPLRQIQWTVEKNSQCNGHYVNVVKAIKWWQRLNSESIPKPKGYPLEHMIGDSCPDGIESVEEGVAQTLDAMASSYRYFAENGLVPELRDRGTDSNVMARISPEDFEVFHQAVTKAASTGQEALHADDECVTVLKWRELLGNKFPKPPSHCEEEDRGGFSKRTERTTITGRRFA
jgi:hypothetical protein